MSKKKKNSKLFNGIFNDMNKIWNNMKTTMSTYNHFNNFTIQTIENLINKRWNSPKYNPDIFKEIDHIKKDIKKYKEYLKIYNEHIENPNSTTKIPDVVNFDDIIKRYLDIDFIINRPNINSLLSELESSPISNNEYIKDLIQTIKSLKDLDTDKDYINVINYTYKYAWLMNYIRENNYLNNLNLLYIDNLITDNTQKWTLDVDEYMNDLATFISNYYDASKEINILSFEISKFRDRVNHNELDYDYNNYLTHIKNASLYLRNCIEIIVGLLIIANRSVLSKKKFNKKSVTVILNNFKPYTDKINNKLITFGYDEKNEIKIKSIFDFENEEKINIIKENYNFVSDNLHYKNIFNPSRKNLNKKLDHNAYNQMVEEAITTHKKLIDILNILNNFRNFYTYLGKDECLICIKDFRLITYMSKKLFN